MKEPTKEIIQFIAETIKQSKDFVVEQAPDVIQQYLGATTMASILTASLCFVVVMISIALIYKDGKKHKWVSFDMNPVITAFGSAGVFLGVTILIANVYKFLYVYLYPKAYLLEKFLM